MSSFVSRAGITELLSSLALALVFVLLPAAVAVAAPKVYLDITKATGRKISLAATPFSPRETDGEKELRRVLERDLTLSGYFTLVPVESLQRELFATETETGKINFASWASWGAELLLRTSYRQEGEALVLQGKVYDTTQRKLLFGREYRGTAGQGARAVHALVDELVKELTGEPGIARTRLALSWTDGDTKRIAVMDYDGRGLRPVSPEGVLSLYPAWFPDGRRLAYVTYRHGRTEVVIHDLQTGRVRSLAYFPGMNAFPDISSDGTSMLLAMSRDGNPEIYRMEVDGSSLKRLTYTKAVEASPVWSPDKKQVAFVSDRTGSPQVFICGAMGGRARRISYTGHYSSSPDWSPTGERIAFTSLVGGSFQLFSVDLQSGQNEQLTFGGANKEDPSWAPNGRHLTYSVGRGSTYRIAILDTRTGEISTLPRQNGSTTSPDWSP